MGLCGSTMLISQNQNELREHMHEYPQTPEERRYYRDVNQQIQNNLDKGVLQPPSIPIPIVEHIYNKYNKYNKYNRKLMKIYDYILILAIIY